MSSTVMRTTSAAATFASSIRTRASVMRFMDNLRMASLSYDQPKMNVGFGCLAAFMLPFLAAGLFTISVGIKEYARGATGGQWMIPIAAGGAFTIFAIGFAAMPLYAIRRSRADAEALEQGVIVDRSGATGVSLLIFAILWNAIAFPIGFIVPRAQDVPKWALPLVML